MLLQSIILEGKNAKAVGYVEGEPVDEGIIKGFSKCIIIKSNQKQLIFRNFSLTNSSKF